MCNKNIFPEKDNALLVVIDIQDGLLKTFEESTRTNIISKSSLIINYFRYKKLPIIVFEQYPKGIGTTNQTIKDALQEYYKPVEKTCFSGCGADGFETAINGISTKNAILVGIESHICVLQTCESLINKGFNVYVPADAVGSRQNINWEIGLKTMEKMGAVITTAEILMFKWFEKAGTPDFKYMLPYLK